MAKIPKLIGDGGAFLAPKGAAGKPDLLTILDDIATDLATLQAGDIPAATVGADLSAPAAVTGVTITGGGASTLGTANGAFEDQNDPVTAAVTDTTAALKSSVDTRLVSIGNNMQELAAQSEANRVDIAALRTELNTMTTFCNALKADLAAARTAVNNNNGAALLTEASS